MAMMDQRMLPEAVRHDPASGFCETNVRAYVRACDGRTGIWFVSLDAARL